MLIMSRQSFIPLILLLLMVISTPSLFSFQDGERLTFDIRYGIIGAGQATLHVEEIEYRNSITAYRITSNARTNRFFDRIFKVRDEIASIYQKITGSQIPTVSDSLLLPGAELFDLHAL